MGQRGAQATISEDLTQDHMVTIILAPSKTMDLTSPLPYGVETTEPLFLDQAGQIVGALRKQSPRQLTKTMGISDAIAAAVHEHYAAWDKNKPGRPALWAYAGDVYKGVQAKTLPLKDAQWAQAHLLIASGLYGLVRPFDGIQAYRLEMKAGVSVGKHKNLYDFWGADLATYVDVLTSEWICNCTSDEYAKPILKYTKKTVVTPYFYDAKPNGTIGPVPIYSKMMRGVLARWMVDNRVRSPQALENFSAHGYHFDAARSQTNTPVFSRSIMVPLKFGSAGQADFTADF